MTARTTTRLVKTALKAAEQAGFAVGAFDVLPGGVVRIIAAEAIEPHVRPPGGGNTCDDLFEGESG